MAIKEIIKFMTDDGQEHSTLQDAQKAEQREEIIKWLMSATDLDDRYMAGNIVDALNNRYTLTLNDFERDH